MHFWLLGVYNMWAWKSLWTSTFHWTYMEWKSEDNFWEISISVMWVTGTEFRYQLWFWVPYWLICCVDLRNLILITVFPASYFSSIWNQHICFRVQTVVIIFTMPITIENCQIETLKAKIIYFWESKTLTRLHHKGDLM